MVVHGDRCKICGSLDELHDYEHEARVCYPALVKQQEAENDQLRKGIKWALGEGPAPDGTWFGDCKPDDAKPYWWRTQLRQMVSSDEQTAQRERAMQELADQAQELKMGYE